MSPFWYYLIWFSHIYVVLFQATSAVTKFRNLFIPDLLKARELTGLKKLGKKERLS